MPGIAAISGSMKSKNGKRIVFTHRASDKPGNGRMYMRQEYQRTAPVSDKEIAARNLFKQITAKVAAMTEEEKKTFCEHWKKANYKFKGKKYATLRGFIIAVLYDDRKEMISKGLIKV